MTRTVTTSPLASLSADEIDLVRELADAAGLLTPSTRFVYVGLVEPAKAEVLAHLDGAAAPPDRRACLMLLDLADGRSLDLVFSLRTGELISRVDVDGSDGQLPISLAEFDIVGDIVKDDPQWLAALAKRGVDPAKVVYGPLSAGWYDRAGEEGRRVLRVTSFRMDHPQDHPWAHPIDGLSVYVDPIAGEVLGIEDALVLPIPEEPGNFQDPEQVGPPLAGLRPIVITQPEGPSFTVDGESITWGRWSFDVGFDQREGLILRRIAFDDGTRRRDVIYRASVSEMVVPYGDPSPVRYWHNYFDTGEYLFGRFVNSLKLGCDCLGEIRYLDAVMSDEFGHPQRVENAICVHEEDFGTLWKHTDQFTGVSEVRRQRRLVVSFFTTIGNYDYGFFWYLYLDGTIELQTKLTGIVFTSSYPAGHRFASELAPGLGAPFHQHLFNVRLDMMVDGLTNAVDEVDAMRVPIGDDNPWGNAFTYRRTRLARESDGAREANAAVARAWHISNTERSNRLGRPVAYVLTPQQNPTLLADPSSSIAQRAAFASKHLWVTRYHPDELFAAGRLVNQHPGGSGVDGFAAADRDIDGQDIVLWHTFGPTHFPRVEDWPIMPVDYAGFTLKPHGFFDRNPALDVPPAQVHNGAGCCHGSP
jgi:primary-amine oxidase